MISSSSLLYIEPMQTATLVPIIDTITRRMCAAYRQARPSAGAWGGVHQCCCGAVSSSQDYHLPSDDLTNSLCIHYVAHHRDETPREELARIEAFSFGEAEPTWREMHDPNPRYPELSADVRQAVQQVESEIEALYREFNDAVARQDWDLARAVRERTRTEHDRMEAELRKKRDGILRDWRHRYLVEHFDAVAEPWIQMKWSVTLVMEGAAPPAIVGFLQAALKDEETGRTLAYRLGERIASFMTLLQG